MQQHLMQMQPMMSAYYPNNITTDVIQQYLDENKSLILKIVESQNLGKLSECAESQARLQRNLMYLAAIADAQPQPPSMHSQYPSGSMMQPGGNNYLQHQQAQSMTSQALMAARSSMLYNQQHQQALHSHLGLSSGGSSHGLSMLQMDANNGGGFPDFSCGPGGGIGDGGSKQDISGSTEG